jgi:hypothetical protein
LRNIRCMTALLKAGTSIANSFICSRVTGAITTDCGADWDGARVKDKAVNNHCFYPKYRRCIHWYEQ